MIDENDDGRLVAYLDNQLAKADRSALETRLVVEPDLRARFAALAAGGLPFRAAFDSALAETPLERMRAKIDALAPLSDASRAAPRPARRMSAIAAALGLLVLGWGIGHYVPPRDAARSVGSDDSDWRRAVAEYASLYTAQTFANAGDAASKDSALAQLSQALGVTLNEASVALPDLAPQRVETLAYDGAPLGQIAYVDAGEPIVFCIIRNGEKDAALSVDKRDDLAIASWAHGGRGYLVAGRRPSERVTALAQALSTRF
jgi:anti-sigma factor RsiW